MADRLAVLRVFDELFWALRRAGFVIATSQAIDAVRAAAAVGLEDRQRLVDALAAVLVLRAAERPRFDRLVADFFAPREGPRRFWDRLQAAGFDDAELAELRRLLDALGGRAEDGALVPLGALLERGPELSRLLQSAGAQRALEALQSRLQAGFFTHKLAQQLGLPGANDRLGAVRNALADAFGHERADALVRVLEAELAATRDEVRGHVGELVARRESERDGTDRSLEDTPFAALDAAEVQEVRRAIVRLVQRLRGRERVRRRRSKRGSIDPHRTLRQALRTGGVPFRPVRRRRRRDKPRLFVLCDVSDSVRATATFMLEFVHAAQDLFEGTRSFVFVSEVGEATRLFREQPMAIALARAYGGGIVPITDNSNYGRALRTFEARFGHAIDRRTTLVILGDGRSNFHDDGAEVLGRLRERCRALLWLSPEAKSRWAMGDSAMARYAPHCSYALEARTTRDLEGAARLVLSARR